MIAPEDGTSTVVRFGWFPAGNIQLDGVGKLRFPVVPTEPGVYRFSIDEGPRQSLYFGEASDVRRRFQRYRTPHQRQPTNMRLNRLLREVLASGGSATAYLARVDLLEINSGLDISPTPDLRRRASRVLIESAAVLAAVAGGVTLVLNLDRGFDSRLAETHD